MDKRLVALKGCRQNGKSESLMMVIGFIRKLYPAAGYVSYEKDSKDEKCIFEDVDGLKIGIETQGDPGCRLPQSLKDFSDAGCNVIICASRTRGCIVEAIESYRHVYDITFIAKKIVTADFEKANEEDAVKILKELGLWK